jgi:hypothetical protein
MAVFEFVLRMTDGPHHADHTFNTLDELVKKYEEYSAKPVEKPIESPKVEEVKTE